MNGDKVKGVLMVVLSIPMFTAAGVATLLVVLGNGKNLQVLPGLGVVALASLSSVVAVSLTIKDSPSP